MSFAFDAVITDLDGTVVRADGSVSAATVRAAEALRQRGTPLLAATARTPAGTEALRTLAPLLSFAVCCSGAVGYVPATGTTAWCERISPAVVADLVSVVKDRLPAAAVAAFNGVQWRMTPAYQAMRPGVHKGPVSVVDAAAVGEADPCSMVIGHPEWAPARTMATLIEAGFDATRIGLHHAGPRFVEVTAAGVDKASGVVRALGELGAAPERSIAFGDMPIDITMFAAVGHSVAMADAPPEVLSAATSRTETVGDDGFAGMLARLGLR